LQKEDQIIDLHFEDFVSDQVATAKKIYKKFNWKLTDETIEMFNNFLNENPKDKHGAHTYSLDTFGLSNEQINMQYTDYLTFLKQLNTKS
jgi:hypothetical protein